MNRRELIQSVFCGTLVASVPAMAQVSPVVATKTSVFGEQPDDKEGVIHVQNIHADGTYSTQYELYLEDYVH